MHESTQSQGVAYTLCPHNQKGHTRSLPQFVSLLETGTTSEVSFFQTEHSDSKTCLQTAAVSDSYRQRNQRVPADVVGLSSRRIMEVAERAGRINVHLTPMSILLLKLDEAVAARFETCTLFSDFVFLYHTVTTVS